MKRKYSWLVVFFLLVVVAGLWWLGLGGRGTPPEDYVLVQRPVQIKPDYTGTVIPPNIAPLNFKVCESASRYLVKIRSENGRAISVFSRNGKIKIPLRRWRSLLKANRGSQLFFDVFVKDKHGRWNRYETITNTIAKEDIDSHIAYRFIYPIHNYFRDIAICQRNLENYGESTVLDCKFLDDACVNCHSFSNNNPESMFIAIRSKKYGNSSILARDDGIRKIATKFGYTAWHPSGQLAAYSLNKVRQFFHTSGMQTRDVVDLDGAITYYNIQSQQVKSAPGLSETDRLESYPAWTPDGKYLYFCSAPILWEDRNVIPPRNYDLVKYDLRRISYDVQADRWGKPETVLSADQTGLSILLPRISPDGRSLLFCMCEYGCFPVYQPSSDLYLMDLKTGEYRKLPVNSEYSESWHSWSSNSRWIAFSSKRHGALFTRTYLCYIDENGELYKPFIMPQKDPTFYDSLLKAYSVPELITGPVKFRYAALLRSIRSADKIEVDLPITGATPAADAAVSTTWQQDRE